MPSIFFGKPLAMLSPVDLGILTFDHVNQETWSAQIASSAVLVRNCSPHVGIEYGLRDTRVEDLPFAASKYASRGAIIGYGAPTEGVWYCHVLVIEIQCWWFRHQLGYKYTDTTSRMSVLSERPDCRMEGLVIVVSQLACPLDTRKCHD